MKDKAPTLIAGEPIDELVRTLRQMPITGIRGRKAQITFDLEDPDFLSWTRAAERYAANLLTPECDLTHHERLSLAVQQVVDEVESELRRRRS